MSTAHCILFLVNGEQAHLRIGCLDPNRLFLSIPELFPIGLDAMSSICLVKNNGSGILRSTPLPLLQMGTLLLQKATWPPPLRARADQLMINAFAIAI